MYLVEDTFLLGSGNLNNTSIQICVPPYWVFSKEFKVSITVTGNHILSNLCSVMNAWILLMLWRGSSSVMGSASSSRWARMASWQCECVQRPFQGDNAEQFYLVESGKVTIKKEDPVRYQVYFTDPLTNSICLLEQARGTGSSDWLHSWPIFWRYSNKGDFTNTPFMH